MPAANGHEGAPIAARLPGLGRSFSHCLVIAVTDKGYRGRFARHVARLGLTHQLGSRPPSTWGFVSVAKQWVVERTFAWLTGFWRLAIDYEFTLHSPKAWLLIAGILLCINYLAKD